MKNYICSASRIEDSQGSLLFVATATSLLFSTGITKAGRRVENTKSNQLMSSILFVSFKKALELSVNFTCVIYDVITKN